MAGVPLINALEIDVEDLRLELETLPLYAEFAERFDEAIVLLCEGRSLWGSNASEPWAIEAVAGVRRNLSAINRWAEADPSRGLAEAVRWNGVWESRATDAQLAAAVGMARVCQAVESLWRWMDSLEEPWREASPGAFPGLAEDCPDGYAELIEEERRADPVAETDARERAADLLGSGRLAMMLAVLYQHPDIPRSVLEDISRAAVHKARQTTASKGGKESGESRRGAASERDSAICAVGKALLEQGRPEREITGIVARRAEAQGLSTKRIRAVLREGGVLPSAKKGK